MCLLFQLVYTIPFTESNRDTKPTRNMKLENPVKKLLSAMFLL